MTLVTGTIFTEWGDSTSTLPSRVSGVPISRSGGGGAGSRLGARIERLRGQEIGLLQGFGAGAFQLRQLRGGAGGAGVFLGNGGGGLGGGHPRLCLDAGGRG